MNRLSTRWMLARAAALVALVVAQSIFLQESELARALLSSAQELAARAAGAVLRLGGLENSVDGIRIVLARGAVDVTDDCVGLDISLFLASAMLVHPAPLRSKLAGFVAAFAVVMTLNWMRVVTLAALAGSGAPAFEVAHVYLWPSVIIVSCVATFLLWARSLPAAVPTAEEAARS